MTNIGQRPRVVDVVRDRTGAALLEFTFVLPALLLLVFGVIQVGVVAYDYILVAHAATVGARTFAYSRNDSSAYSDTVTAIDTASSFTTTQIANLTITLSVDGTACSSNSGCQNALGAAWATGSIPPEPVSVTVSYACGTDISIMPTYLINITGICPINAATSLPSITSTMQQPVQ
jgi:Flp pilus assembly protein TadG